VGEGTDSFLVAAFVSNVAFARIELVMCDLQHQRGHLSLSEFVEICSALDSSAGPDMWPHNLGSVDAKFLGRLQSVDRAISAASVECKDAAPCSKCLQATARDINARFCSVKDEDRTFDASLFQAMDYYRSDEATKKSPILSKAPLFVANVDYSGENDKLEEHSAWSITLGMSMLSQSHGSYLKFLDRPNSAALCRLKTLKLAQQVSKQIATILEDTSAFPCRCTQTLAYHLQTVLIETNNFASHNRWDIYIQSPWTAGNHALEILDLCHYYGGHLMKYRHYVGAVLYSYIVVKQLGGLESIPVLDLVCAQLAGSMFPGGKVPASNFHGSWARYVGCRLKFRKGQSARHGSATWCLAIPPHQARAAAGLNLPGYETGEHTACLTFRIKQQDYHLSADHGCPRYRNVMPRRLRSDSVVALQSENDKEVLDSIAAMASADLEGEPDGRLPIARLNLFGIFERCVKIISSLTDKMHKASKPGGKDYCICFCSEIFTAADRIMTNRRLGRLDAWKKHERKLVENLKDALKTVFGDVKEEDLLLDI
jgi:hypothetical protein